MSAARLQIRDMKQTLTLLPVSLLYVAVLFFGCLGVANATLLVFSSEVVVDDGDTATLVDDLYFYRDLSRFRDMTYAEQLASIESLNSELDGVGPWKKDWHLAKPLEMSGLFDDPLGVTAVFLPSAGSDYFAGRYESPVIKEVPEHMWYEVLLTGGSPPVYTEKDSVPDTSLYDGAWAVATYSVPEPPLFLMLYIGVAGMLLRERCFGRK